MIALLLWLLATIDAAFIGYREAAGRNALIDKSAYYRRAMLRGALFGQVAAAIIAVVIACLILISDEPSALIRELERAGLRMLTVYIPYAIIIFLAFAVRAFPSVDIRSITSVLIFGPFTLIRPLVVVAGVAAGILASPRFATLLVGLLILALIFSLELLLGKLHREHGYEQQGGRMKDEG
jgi:hypothetical protein